MPKLKSRKGAQKRFNLTKTGKLMRRRQNSRHLRTAKSKSHQRRMKEPGTISSSFSKKIVRMM